MRLISKTTSPRGKRRRGLSFIEVIASVIIIALITVVMLCLVMSIRHNMKSTIAYTDLKVYAVNKIEEVQRGLEEGMQIDSENYNDDGTDSGIYADVRVEDIGIVQDKNMYRVELSLQHIETGNKVSADALLREGCIAHAP